MLLVELIIDGTIYYVSNEQIALTHSWLPFVASFTAPKYETDKAYGGYCHLGFGSIEFSPDLFGSEWPPPKILKATVKYTASTEAAAVTLWAGDIRLPDNSISVDGIKYDIHDTIYETKALQEGADYDGDTVAYPRAFGTVTHVEPLRVADNGGPTYHLGGLASGSRALEIVSFTYYNGGAGTKVMTAGAHGYGNGETVVIAGNRDFDGSYTIANAAGTSFTIVKAFPTTLQDGLPIAATCYQAGDLAVYDDGVPINENVTINGDGTFTLSANPVGKVTMSGASSENTLTALMTWAQGRLGIGSIDTTKIGGSVPAIAKWQTEQMPLVDFMSEACSYGTRLFYIASDTIYVVDLLTDNGSRTLTEAAGGYFSATYGARNAVASITAEWEASWAFTGKIDGSTATAKYIKTKTKTVVESLYTISSGTADGTSAGKLVDSGATFSTDGIKIGHVARNTTDDTSSVVTAVAETQLTLVDDIFVSGEDYVVGPSMPYGEEIDIEPYHTSKSVVSTALQRILQILSMDVAEIRIPFEGTMPAPGEKFTFDDSAVRVNTSTYIRARTIAYDFDRDEIAIAGEGLVAAA